MAIVKMKRIRLIALAEDRDALLSSLLHVGCVEISEPELPQGEADEPLLHRDKALAALRKYAPQKGGLLTPRPLVGEGELLDREALGRALEKARTVNDHAKAAGQCLARETRLEADIQSLLPWQACELPLDGAGTRTVAVLLGTVPRVVDVDAMAGPWRRRRRRPR